MRKITITIMWVLFSFAFVAAAAVLFSLPTPMQSVAFPTTVGNTLKLAWDPAGDTNVSGYRVYYGDSPGSRQTAATVGKTTNTVIDRLVAGKNVYVHVVSYNSVQIESEPSNSITNFIYPKIFTRIYSIAADASAPNATNVWQISTNGTTWSDYKTSVVTPGVIITAVITNDAQMKLIRIR